MTTAQTLKPATLHRGKTWWIVPDGARGFNEMHFGFHSRERAEAFARELGYLLRDESA